MVCRVSRPGPSFLAPDRWESSVSHLLRDGVRRRWHAEAGYREILKLAVPLIISTSAWSVQHFVDRMFLAWYSPQAVAAAMPGGMASFAVLSLFIGTAGYVGTFVAQYHGADRPEEIGPVVWQGIYLSAAAACLHLALVPLAGPFFRLVGHEPEVRDMEIAYFQILCLGAGPAVAGNAISGFFAGRGKTWTVMMVNVLVTAVNLVLDYLLIFGRLGFPEMGIRGAALATIIATAVGLCVSAYLLMLPEHARRFGTRSGRRFRPALFRRLIRFGFPSGVQFFIDSAGFTAFILLVGRLGVTELAASNIAMNVNTLAFMPMIGIGMAVSILTGQHLGADRPDVAERGAWSGFHLTLAYMTGIATAYILLPGVFLAPYAARMSAADVALLRPTVVILLRFVALYSLFDGLNIIFASVIKGAGDTRFVMQMILMVSLGVLVVPSYVALQVLGRGLYTLWAFLAAYVIVLGLVFLMRFLGGRWKSMRVIEPPVAAVPPAVPDAPTRQV
ncbi:MAG: MATE family efflux transporter [Candidatus Brocadiaceae bacterium]|nr:MATE family efflux transporter [Candidatus Brocadiaceae bacterium]